MVLWTKLAPDPLAEDGHGGMPAQVVPVHWEVAEDVAFRKVVARGLERATPELGHSVHADVRGLRPGRHYYYRFRAGRVISPVGQTRTAPAADAEVATLKIAHTSCQNIPRGWFTAYRDMVAQDLDLVLFLGDYIYEGPAAGSVGRPHQPDHEIYTLSDYRIRHGQYRLEPELQAAHARYPWLVVWDDHELDNNWADEHPDDDQPIEDFLRRRAISFQVYYEFMPLRQVSVPDGIDMRLFRRIHWGRMATFHMLDTRQYRDDQACGSDFSRCPEAFDPDRSILGAEQEAWLLDGFRRSRARWDVLGQQVAFARRWVERDTDDGPALLLKMDAWDGYVASQERMTRGWVEAGVRNQLVLSGDVHAHWANDLKLDYDDPAAPLVGSELISSSISASGDGKDGDGTHRIFKDNPHLHFFNDLRGYVKTTFTPAGLQADYQCVPYISRPGAEVFTRASFVVEDGVRGLQQTYDRPPENAPAGEDPRQAVEALIHRETSGG